MLVRERGDAMSDDERLRTAWSRLASEPAGEPCPTADAIFSALNRESSLGEREAILAHTRICGPCSEAWRIGAEVVRPELAAPTVRRVWVPVFVGALALAAGILLFVVPPREDPFRDAAGGGEVSAEMANGGAVPRTAVVLRWTGGTPSDRFIVRVFDDTLEPLHESGAVAEHELAVPEAVFSKLRTGATVYWQVETIGSDGTRRRSETFDLRLE